MRVFLLTLSIVMLAAGSAFASKQDELDALALKPWSITDLPQLSSQADVNETEPNDTCPGEAYTLGDVFHGALNPGGDVDWINFSATAGDEITVGTDADPGLPTVDTYLELWDDTCTTMLAFNDDGGPGLYSLIADFPAPYTGTYAVKVRGYSSSSTGNYILIGDAVTPQGPGFCPLGTYKAIKRNVMQEIVDGPYVLPPIEFWDMPGYIIVDVVVDLNIEHTWVGDLKITLRHTSDGGVVTEVDLLDRPGVPQSTYGCSGDLVSDPEAKYYFSSRPDLAPLGEDDCPAIIGAACYNIAPESLNDLSIFNGMDFGDGTWELVVTDNAAGDNGFIYNWSIHLLGDVIVGVEESSWGAIKATYR